MASVSAKPTSGIANKDQQLQQAAASLSSARVQSQSAMDRPATAISAPPCVARSLVISNPTTFVQADCNSFREVVQKLTGASPPPPPLPSSSSQHVGPRRAAFKLLHERRQRIGQLRSLDLKHQQQQQQQHHHHHHHHQNQNQNQGSDQKLVSSSSHSPVTPLVSSDLFEMNSAVSPSSSSSSRTTPTSCCSSFSGFMAEEERAIAEKRFYLHPSPVTSPASQPRLLPLFPLHSDTP